MKKNDSEIIEELATALNAMIVAAKGNKCGLKIADDAIISYKEWAKEKEEQVRNEYKLRLFDFICPETGIVNCLQCTGESCNLCGAGSWNNSPTNCQHDVVDRHKDANGKYIRLPLNHQAWQYDMDFENNN